MQALRLYGRSMPFLVYRLGICLALACAPVLAIGLGAGLGYGLGLPLADGWQMWLTHWGGIAGLVAALTGLLWLYADFGFYVRGAHVAVLSALHDGKDVPPGWGQIAFGQMQMRNRFGHPLLSQSLERGVLRALRAAAAMEPDLLGDVSVPGLNRAPQLLQGALWLAARPIVGVIFAQILRVQSTNPWAGARAAVVLYAQNVVPMLANAAGLMVAGYGVTLLTFLMLAGPVEALLWFLPGDWGTWWWAFAASFAAALKVGLFDPFALVCLTQVYQGRISGETPDASWSARLEAGSDRFRVLGERAAAWRAGQVA